MTQARTLADIGGTGAGSNIKEQLVMLCDGNNYTVGSGTYTAANVTAIQDLTTSYVDITGSSISYTAPSDSVCVLYEFIFGYAWLSDHAIGHFKFFIDSDEVTDQRQTLAVQNKPQWQQSLRYVIPIGGTADTDTGRQSTWTTAKTLKIQSRGYGGSNLGKVHTLRYWDGANSTDVLKPKLIITALG